MVPLFLSSPWPYYCIKKIVDLTSSKSDLLFYHRQKVRHRHRQKVFSHTRQKHRQNIIDMPEPSTGGNVNVNVVINILTF